MPPGNTPWVDEDNAVLLTDLYELTMADSYHQRGMDPLATFDLFVRSLPPERSFLVACGLEEALDHLENMSFSSDHIDYLRSTGLFSSGFLDRLSGLRFTGEVAAVPEGEVVFAVEPLLRVTAPLIEAQLVETFLLNCVGFQTMIATKAARVSLACGDKSFVDFSPRRDHGADAALKAARAATVGGAAGTSNVLAGQAYGLTLSGTMAHSYVMAWETELEAFRAFAADYPGDPVLLIDTFDVAEGARHAAKIAHELTGKKLAAVRIDSGDLLELSRTVRTILDGEGLADVKIVASGDLDEHRIAALLDAGAPIDSFGVGTQLGTSGDAPALGCVYKLVAEEDLPKIKLSAGKTTLPGKKQVYRFSSGGRYTKDVIALESEDFTGGEPLLQVVMSKGTRTVAPRSLQEIAAARQRAIDHLPERLKELIPTKHPYEVTHSSELDRILATATAAEH